MKIYVAYDDHKQFLQTHLPKGMTIVDDKASAEWLVDGALKAEDVHENLKGVIIPFTGHNSIDLDAMKTHNLMLFNTTVHSVFVAEMAHRLILASLGGLVTYHKNLEKGDWSGRTIGSEERVPWATLIDQRVGIYGYGRIGKHLETFLRPYTKHLYTIDRGKDYGKMRLVPDLPTLIETCDIVVIAAPLNKYTENAFDKTILSKMQGKTLVNVGRGKIVNEKALYDALTQGTLARYASDVWYVYPNKDTDYPLPSRYPVHLLDNVIMTPHCGGHTETSQQAMIDSVYQQLIAIKNGDYANALDLNKLK